MSLKHKLANFVLPDTWLFAYKNRREKVLYLSFDDGPHADILPVLMDVLAQHKASSTFFWIGRKAINNEELLNKAIKAGHLIANHSYNHKQFHTLTTEEKIEEIEATNRIIAKCQGKLEYSLFRPPHGKWNLALLFALIRRKITLALWSVDSLDYSDKDAGSLVLRLQQKKLRSGDIILFHDDKLKSVEMLRQLLPYWQKLGFTFRSLKSR